MAKKKEISENLDKMLKKQKYVIGTEKTIKHMVLGKIKKIILAEDLDNKRKESIKKLAKISDIEVVELKKTRKEIAEEIKKPFNIGCIGIE